jgi:hypothetical protein
MFDFWATSHVRNTFILHFYIRGMLYALVFLLLLESISLILAMVVGDTYWR